MHVYEAGQHLFADAGFSQNQYGHIRCGHLPGDFFDLRDLRTRRDEVARLSISLQLAPETLHFVLKALLLQDVFNRQLEFLFFKRLGQVVEGAHPDGFHYALCVADTRQHDDGNGRVSFSELRQDLKTIGPRKQDIEKNYRRAITPLSLWSKW